MGKKQKLRCQHDNTYFDRTLCAEPCGDMHTSCNDCGYIFGGCYWLSRDAEPNELPEPEVTVYLDGKPTVPKFDAFVSTDKGESWHEVDAAPLPGSYKALMDAISLEPQRVVVGGYPLSDAVVDYGQYTEYDGMAAWEKELLEETMELITPLPDYERVTTHEDIHDLILGTLNEIAELNDTKGREYATDEDGLANFKNRAAQMGVTPAQVWGIFYGKHSDAINSYIRRGEVLSEPIEGRIDDAILYLILLKALIREGSA